MSLLSYKHGSSPKIELKSKECIDLVLQPLKYHVTIKVNGSLTSEDIFRIVEDKHTLVAGFKGRFRINISGVFSLE